MSLGEAFVDARADVKGFLPQLKIDLDKALATYVKKIKVAPDTKGFVTKLKADLRGFDPVEVKLTASTASLRARIEAQFGRGRPIPLSFGLDDSALASIRAQLGLITQAEERVGDQGRGAAGGFLEMSDAADKATASIRAQLRALIAAGASEREALALLRKQITELAARARELNIDIPVDVDTTRLASAIERAVERADAQGRSIQVPITADLTALRAQLAGIRDIDAIEIPIHADLTLLRAQLESLNPVVDIEARLRPGNLKELRTQAGRLAAINVKATIDQEQFRRTLLEAADKGILVKIKPNGIVKFRTIIQDYLKTFPAEVGITPGNIAAFREKIREATKLVNVPVHIQVGNISEFRAAIAASLTGAAALGVNLKVGNPGPFKAEVRALLGSQTFPINIRPVITPADRGRLDAQARAAGDSAGKSLGSRLNKAFSFAFGSLGRNFRSLERASLATAGVGEAAFVGIGIAGLGAASKLELLNTALENIAESTANTERPLLSAGQTVDALRQKIIDFALQSPLGVDSVSDAVVRLTSSLKVTGNEALTQINAIAGALAITPDGLNTEGLAGVVKALTQIASAGKLGGQELLQLSNQIPVLSRTEIFTDLARQAVAAGISIKGVTKDTQKLTAAQLAQVKKLQKAGAFDSNAALNAIFSSLEKTPGAEKAVDNFNKSLTGTVQRIKETLQFSLGSLFLGIIPQITAGLNKASKAITDVLSGDTGKTFAKDFADQFNVVIGIFTESLPGILKAIDSIGKAFTGIFREIGPDGFAKIGTTIAQVFDAIGKSIGPTIDFISKAIEIIAPIVKGIIDAIIKAAPAFQPFLKSIVGLAAALGGFLKDVGGPLLQIVGKALSGLAPLIDIITVAVKILGAVLGAVLGNVVVQKILSVIATFLALGAGIEVVAAKLLAFRTSVSGFLLPILGRFSSILIKLFNNFTPLGRILGLIPALLSRIAAATGPVASAIRFIGTEVVAVGKLILQIFGPLALVFRGVGEAIKNSIVGAIDLVLAALQKVFELAGHLPFIGDKFDGLAAKVQNYRAELAAVPSQINTTAILNIVVTRSDAPVNGNLPGQLASQATDRAAGSLGDAAKRAGKNLKDLVNVSKTVGDKIAKDFGIGLGDFGGAGGGAGGSGGSKTAAETLADRIKAAKDKILESLVDFRKTITEGSSKEIDAAFKSLRKSLQTIPNFDESGIVKKLRADNAKLDKLADARDALTKRIEDRTSKFNELFDSFRGGASDAASKLVAAQKELADAQAEANTATGDSAADAALRLKAAQDALRGLGVTVPTSIAKVATQIKLALGQLFVTPNGSLTAQAQSGATAFKAVLDKRVADLKAFLAEITDLKKKGLSAELLDQLVQAGPGSDLAASLSGASAAAVAGLNKTQAEIDKVAAAIAGNGAVINEQAEAAATAAGKAVADGLVAGLKANRDKLKEEIKSLVAEVIKLVKSGLGIKSPSRVMAGLAKHIPTGLAKGVFENLHHVEGAMAKVTDIVSGTKFAPISLPELSARALGDAQAKLSALTLPALDARQTLAIKAPERSDTIDYGKLAAAMESGRSQSIVHYNTPVTATFASAPADPHSFVATMNGHAGSGKR